MDDRQGRISKLSERFKTHSGRPKQATRERERRSFYLDVAVMTRVDEEHKALNHRTYPDTVSKSVFLETILEYGLENLEAIRGRIAAGKAEKDSSS
jgi:aspartate aminotransferase-like enzyme